MSWQQATFNAKTLTLVGVVARITYFNEESGFTVMRVQPDGKMPPDVVANDGTIVVVGAMVEFNPGERAEFEGEWITDARYGKQFKVRSAQPLVPTSEAGLVAYLGSGLVKGIGEKTAAKIVSHFGIATLDVLDNHPERLIEVLKRAQATALAATWSENIGIRRVMIYLQGYGVTPKMARRIYEEFGADTIQKVQNNPYMMADEIHGIGFVRADGIARRMNVPLDSPLRLRAGLTYALGQLTNDGHVFAPRPMLLAKLSELLGIEADVNVIGRLLEDELGAGNLIEDRVVLANEPAIYLPEYHEAETSAAVRLRALVTTESDLLKFTRSMPIGESVRSTAQDADIELSEQQLHAVTSALTHKVAIMTGGPGTGKTTSIKALIQTLEKLKVRYHLTSPTGRAAKRMSEATEHEAFTIHRLLGFIPGEGFYHDEDNPLEIDMLIVDEASMVDLLLFDDILKALRPTTHLFLVGDIDQLPSVGAGNVLRDVIDSGAVSVTRLAAIFRQDKDSDIVANAHRINQGDEPYLNRSKDFFFFQEEDPDAVAALVVDIVKNRIPTKFGFNPMFDVQVIAPMYRGQAGVTALNTVLQAALNNPNAGQINAGTRTLRVGDKVMQTRNNYELDVFNGDIGFIRQIDVEEKALMVDYDGRLVPYDSLQMEELIHAYCISTHRSQGSEYAVVVMPILTQHYMMLQRNLLYTAVTRAKKMVVLVGMRKAVQMAVKNDRVARRFSGLSIRLQS
ncbi:MAG: ATP-dependent RecD-like DNA helicase [Chloroflexota bacterium]|nr:ATP-dependent RecD-like DNA helicase [Chloroflexota bacterium]